MAASASSMPICSAERSQPPQLAPIWASESWAWWPRIRRQRFSCSLSSGIFKKDLDRKIERQKDGKQFLRDHSFPATRAFSVHLVHFSVSKSFCLKFWPQVIAVNVTNLRPMLTQ